MSINELKNLIHALVDKSNNKYMLELIYNLSANSESENMISWELLSDDQKELILKAYEQSENENKLSSHEEIMHRIKNEI